MLQAIGDFFSGLKQRIQGTAQPVVDTTGLSNVNPPGVASESPGFTTTGGKRYKKTRRARKTKKTARKH